MLESYLIQRLQKPMVREGKVLTNPFSFGGGMANGGLSDKGMDLVKTIFQFDYMGSAEFEFGALPETLKNIAKNIKDYIGFETDVTYRYIKGWKKDNNIKKGKSKVFVICRRDCKDEVVKRIQAKAKGDYGRHKNNFDTKGAVQLDRSLGGTDASDKRNVGWLELDNGYFFFTDKEMFIKTTDLFGMNDSGG